MKSWTSKKSKKDKEKDKDKKSEKKGEKKEELPAPKPALSISSAGGWAKSSNRPDDAILALLKTECDKQIQGVSTERKTIAVIKKEEPKSEEPKNDGDEEEFLEEGLVISGTENGKPIIKGGNIVKLVEFLTHHVHSDQKYMIAFMRTFRSFTTPKELLELLIERFDSVDSAEKGIDVKTAKVIRLRVSNVFKYWLSNGFYDFEEDQDLLRKLEDYIASSMLPALGSGELSPAVNLQKIIAKQKNPEERQKEREKNFSDKPPMPHLPKNINAKEKVVPILTYHPEELARQLTLIDYNLFTSIKPLECLNQNWMHKTQKEELAPNILAMIRRFNDVSTWVASEILKCKDLALRTKVLKQIIEIAEFCKNLNNFNTVMEIVSGLQSASVFRLKQTWGGLSKNYVKSFEEMRDIVSREKNYANFRSYLHNVNPPCIPYLGMYLTDLTFIEEGNKDLLPDGLINFTKRRRLSEVIAEIQTYQYTPYCLAEVSFIKEYLLGVECLPEEQCYKLSLKREARGGAVNNEEEQEEDEPFGEMEKISGYNFDEPDTDSTIIFEKDVSAETSFVPISSANLVKLVERLTYHKYQDTDFVSTFLMALNKLTTPKDFFNLLEIRFNIPKPKNPSKQQLAQFTKVRLIPIHIRIYNVLKIWVNTYIEDFIGNEELINRVGETLNAWSESNKQLSNTVDAVKKIFAKKIADNVQREEDVLIGSLCDGTESGVSITQFEAEDLAKQLCLLEQAIFVNIKPRECLFISDPNVKQESSPTIYAMKKNFDLTKNWAASEFLKQTDLESRVKVLTLLIATAEKLVQIKNFNSSMSIIGGIKSIQNELENSLLWSYVSPSTLNIFKQLEQYYKNPSSLKPLEKPSGNPVPTLPFLDAYIKQLITIHDKPDLVQNLINFEKRRQQYEVFKIWNTFNQEPYSHDKTSCFDYLQTVKIFSPVEIRKKAEALERVAESKFIDKSRIIRADSIDGYDNSLSDSPRGKDEQKAIVKSSMISLISEEKDLIQEVISVAKKELAKELMSELKKYTECVRDEIAMTNQQLGLPNNAEMAAERIILRIFPGALVVPVSETDNSGNIFGWEEEFTLYQVDDSDDKWLIHITPKVLKPDLSAAFKVFELFKSVPGCADRQNVILTSRVTEEAKEIAGRFGVELLSFV